MYGNCHCTNTNPNFASAHLTFLDRQQFLGFLISIHLRLPHFFLTHQVLHDLQDALVAIADAGDLLLSGPVDLVKLLVEGHLDAVDGVLEQDDLVALLLAGVELKLTVEEVAGSAVLGPETACGRGLLRAITFFRLIICIFTITRLGKRQESTMCSFSGRPKSSIHHVKLNTISHMNQ